MVIAALLAWANSSPHKVSEGNHQFFYPKPFQWMLLAGIAIWIVAAVAPKYTASPGIGSHPLLDDAFIGLFLCAAVGTGVYYAFVKRFYILIDDKSVRWRKFKTISCFDFSKLDEIRIKALNKGLERLSVFADGKVVLEVSSTIQDFGQLKMLMELRARAFGVAVRKE
jgi:hypothetical protein